MSKKMYISVIIFLTVLFMFTGIENSYAFAVQDDQKSSNTYEEDITIQKINSGQALVDDYKALGITSVQNYNLDIVNREIQGEKNNKKSKLTTEEIKRVINKVIDNISNIVTRINKGQGTLDDYKYIDINDVTSTNLPDVNEWIRGKLDITEIKGEINVVLKSLRNINDGNASLSDFKTLELSNVIEDNITIIEKSVLDKRKAKGDDLTRAEIKALIDENLSTNKLLDKIKQGLGTIDDYNKLKVTSVTEINIVAVNDYVKGKDFKNVVTLQKYVDIAVKSFVNINEGKETIDDYNILSISGVTEVNIESIRANIKVCKDKKGSYLTKSEIIISVDNTLHYISAFEKINAGTASVDDYSFIGVTGVNINNLAVINVNVRGGNYTAIDVLQIRVNTIISIYDSMAKINQIYVKISNGEATVDDYFYIGITGVSSDNVAFVNEKIKGTVYTNSTAIQIKVTNIVKYYDAFVRINAGNGTIDDYILIGVTGVSLDNLFYINNNIKGNNYFEKDKLQLKVNELVIEYETFLRINDGTATLDDYKVLGITGINADNIVYINAQLKGGSYFIKDKLQLRVDSLVKEYIAFVNINAGTATLDDYNILKILNVNADNLTYINLHVKGKNYFNVSLLQADVDIYVKEFNIYSKINLGTAEIEDYEALGITGVTIENKIYVDADLKGRGYTVLTDVQARVDEVCKVYKIFIKINAGEAVLDDYKALGITSVTAVNIVYVNADLKGKGYLTTTAIKNAIEADLNIYSALYRINHGKGSLNDYKLIGAVNVTLKNVVYVNGNMRGACAYTISDAQVKVDNIINIYELNIKITAALERINDGSATIDDYDLLGVEGVTVDNLIYVDADLKGRDYCSLDEIQARINEYLPIYCALLNVNAGNATLDDYNTLKVTGVTVDNITIINADLKGKNLLTADAVQIRINNNVLLIALNRITNGKGTLDDYALIGCTNVVEANIEYVNGALKDYDKTALEDVKVKVTTSVNEYEALVKINAGNAEVNDYTLIGISGVTVDNLSYVNAKIKNAGIYVIADINVKVANIIEVYNHYAVINLGTAAIKDYEALGLTCVTAENIVYVNAELKGKNLFEVSDIQVIINSVVKIQAIFDKVNAGTANLDDYNAIGVTGVTASNIVDINLNLKGKNYRDKDALQEGITKIAAYIDIYNRINLGNGTLDDYAYLGIDKVTVNNLVEVNLNLKGKNLRTIDEISVAVNNIIKIGLAYDRINAGEGTLDDYNLIGAEGVTISSLNSVNLSVKGKNYRNKADIQIVVDNVIKIEGIYDRINAGDATLDDYKTLGALKVTADNIVDINLDLKGKNLRNLDDINGAIDNVLVYVDIYNRINLGSGTLDDYKFLGAARVTIDNLAEVNLNLKGLNIRNPEDIRVKVNNVIDINLAFDRINEGNGTLDDYKVLGADRVTADNIVYINADLKGQNIRDIDDIRVRINNVVEINLAYDRINAGEGTLDDYKLLGADRVNVNNIAYVNINLKGQNIRVLDEIKVKIGNIIDIDDAYTRINDGNGTLDDYKLLGVSTVTVDNITNINLELKGKNIRDPEQLKIKIDNIIKLQVIYDRINAGEGTIDDYIFLGIDRINVKNIDYVNAELKGKDIRVLDTIKVKINNVIDVNIAYDDINNGKGTLDDYKVLGIDRVTVDNIVYVNAELKGQNIRVINDIRVKVNNTIDITEAYDRINDGNGTVDDYILLGITNVNVNNIVYVNAELKGQNIRKIDDIKVKVDNVVKVNEAYDRINDGNGTIEDYKLLKITDVTVDNIIDVNLAVKGKNYRDAAKISIEVANVVKFGPVYGRINAGIATVEDYTSLGIKDVNDNNLGYLNDEFKGQKLTNLEDIQVKAENVVKINAAYDRINDGNGTIDDYKLLGVTDINAYNIVYVNAELKGKNIRVIQDIRVKVNNVIVVNAAYDKINQGAADVDDYKALGIDVSVNNLAEINLKLKGQNIREINVIRTHVNNVVKVNIAYENINNGEGTLDDYKIFGTDVVTVDNIQTVNLKLKGKNLRNPVLLKENIIKVVNTNEVYIKINDGTATPEDYTYINIVNVNVNNVDKINLKLKGKNYVSVTDIQAEVNNVIKVNDAYNNIKNGTASDVDYAAIGIDVTANNKIEIIKAYNDIKVGTASLDDYNLLNITGVTADNIAHINIVMPDDNYVTIPEIQTEINSIINVNGILEKINAGTAVPKDYAEIGVTGVTDVNIGYVNGAVAGKGYTSTSQIQDIKADVEKVLYDDFEVNLNDDDNTAQITSYTGNNTVVVIPESITKNGKQYKVTGIAMYAFEGNEEITSIIITDSVTSIGENAFDNCSNLKTITLGKNVQSIGVSAFDRCTSLTEIKIPDSVKSISESAFAGCERLETVEIGAGVTSIDKMAFSDCTNLKKLVISSNSCDLDEQCLNCCTSLTNIIIKNYNNNDFKNSGLNLDDYYKVSINGDNFNEVEFVKKDGNSLIFNEDNYVLYNGNSEVDDFEVYSDMTLTIKEKNI